VATKPKSATSSRIAPDRIDAFAAMCKRERCPFAVVGHTTDDGQLVVSDALQVTNPVAMALDVLLGKPPRMTRDTKKSTAARRRVRHPRS